MKAFLAACFGGVLAMAAAPSATKSDRHEVGPLALSDPGMQLILDFEVGGGAPFYNRFLARPSWPGESSGVTIGVGYDLGYNTRAQIAQDWGALPKGTLARLQACAGIKGSAARLKTQSVRDIVIPWDMALAVYERRTLPRFAKETVRAYPGTENLHPNIQSAMLSWVFNRGGGITSSSRDREKRAIRSAIPGDPRGLPPQFRSSKRLWTNTPGLIRRREAEAKLIEASFSQ